MYKSSKVSLLAGLAIVSLVLIVLFSVLGGDVKDTVERGAESSEQVVAELKCETVSDTLTRNIQEGANTVGVTLRNAKAVRSNSFESVYFITADLQGPGLEGSTDLVTFATNRLDNGGGILMSVDSVAKEFFVFPDASTTDAGITMSDDGAVKSQECVESSF